MGKIQDLDPEHQANAVCSLCGETPARGYWHGHAGHFYVCRTCALDVLPALIADTVTDHNEIDPASKKKQELEHIEKRFWRALYLAKVSVDRKKRGA